VTETVNMDHSNDSTIVALPREGRAAVVVRERLFRHFS
jgi:hypothetical protein